MKHAINSLVCVATAAVAFFDLTPQAFAEDTLKVAVSQRGWDTSAAELGQAAGIFKQHGIVLDLLPIPGDSSEAEQATISGSADVGVGVGLVQALRAYLKREPVRIIGASMTGSANFWYVPTTSQIKTIKDINGRSIAHPPTGAPDYYDVFDFMDQYRVKARPVPAGGAGPTLNQVMLGNINVGWAVPPFGLDALEEEQIRIIARANDVPKVRNKTTRVIISSANTLEGRKEVLARFMQAYRETIEWMYSDPAAIKSYAEIAGISEAIAHRLRDAFSPKNMLAPDQVSGLNAAINDAVSLRYIRSLSSKQISELIQIPVPLTAQSVGGWRRLFSTQP